MIFARWLSSSSAKLTLRDLLRLRWRLEALFEAESALVDREMESERFIDVVETLREMFLEQGFFFGGLELVFPSEFSIGLSSSEKKLSGKILERRSSNKEGSSVLKL